MANRFYVGGNGGSWGVTSSWASTSGGASGASVPTASDSVFIDANSGANNSVNVSTNVCLALDASAAPAGFSIQINSGTLTISGAYTNNGNCAIVNLATGIVFNATGSVNVTCGGTSLSTVNFNGAGGTWVCQDAFKAGAVTLTNGTLNLNGQANCTATSITTAIGTKGLTTGTSPTLTLTGSFNNAQPTGFTFTSAGTPVFTFSGSAVTFAGGGTSYTGVDIVLTGVAGTCTFSGTGTVRDITNNRSSGTTLSFSGSWTCRNITCSAQKRTFNIAGGSILTFTGTASLSGLNASNLLTITNGQFGGATTTANFCSITNNTGPSTGGNSHATNSTNGGGNTSWNFDYTQTVGSGASGESLGLTDSNFKASGTTKTDSEPLTDSMSAAPGHAFTKTDAEGITDAIIRAVGHTQTDAMNMSDVGVAEISSADPLQLTDVLTIDIGHLIIEALGLTDAMMAVSNYPRSKAEAISLHDAMTASAAHPRTTTDALALLDALTAVLLHEAPTVPHPLRAILLGIFRSDVKAVS